jgi:glycosyltransferase involved in cell wall biosynthesis
MHLSEAPHGSFKNRNPVTKPRAIRICRVIARINGGGTAVHLQNLAANLDRSRYIQVTICGRVSPGEIDVSDDLRKVGLDIISFPSLQREIRLVPDLITLYRLIAFFREWKPDIVETHTAKAGTLGRVAARIAGVPARIHVFHGHVFDGFFSARRAKTFLQIERWLATQTTRIIALGEHQRTDLLTRGVGFNAQVVSIPLGFDLQRFSSSPIGVSRSHPTGLRHELGISHADRATVPVISMIARLVPTKAHEVFLAAAQLVLEEIPSARFVIVGDGEQRSRLEALADQLLPHIAVRFLGWRTDTPAIFSETDLIMHTSDSEGMPVSIIEALASGVPVVATNVGGIPDLIRDGVNGHLVPPRNPEAVARAALSILRDPNRRASMAVEARASVVPEYEVDTLVARMDRLYREIVTGLD